MAPKPGWNREELFQNVPEKKSGGSKCLPSQMTEEMPNDFNHKTIEELHDLLVKKEISAVELTQATLADIKEREEP